VLIPENDGHGSWWRNGIARNAAVIALVGFCVALSNAWLMAKNEGVPTELLNLICVVVVPASGGVAAANALRTDSSVARMLVGIAVGALVLGVLIASWFAIYLKAGGSFHM
jgi:hypothetical protein